MSNKKKIDTIKYRIGNYIFTKKTVGIERISVQAVSGNWEMSWRADNETYLFVDSLLCRSVEKAHEYLEAWISVVYATSNGYKDSEFMTDFASIFHTFQERYAKEVSREPLSDEEDLKIIEQERQKYDKGK